MPRLPIIQTEIMTSFDFDLGTCTTLVEFVGYGGGGTYNGLEIKARVPPAPADERYVMVRVYDLETGRYYFNNFYNRDFNSNGKSDVKMSLGTFRFMHARDDVVVNVSIGESVAAVEWTFTVAGDEVLFTMLLKYNELNSSSTVFDWSDYRDCLSGVDLTNVDATDMDFSNEILSTASLDRTNFSGSIMQNTNCSTVSACRAIFVGCDLRSAIFTSADLEYAEFTSSNLNGAQLNGSSLISAKLSHVDLTNTRLAHSNMEYADLRHSNLPAKDIGTVSLFGANLTNASIDGVPITQARITELTT